MAAVNFELKEYQEASLGAFRDYLKQADLHGGETAFVLQTKLPFYQAPYVADGTPYVCLRVPTGGGKTIMGAHAVGIAAKEFLHVANPMVLWLVPSTPILEQTVAALKNQDHPYRVALAKDFGRNISVLTKSEALAMSRADAEGGACIIVSTIQAFRIEETEGRKVYEDAGSLMDHFSGLSEDQVARLDKVPDTHRPVSSLANLLKLHRPMVIVDEAHNARSALSFDTLARFDPSLILELTATPNTDHVPAKDKHASNILHSVSAAELKAEQMIKLPIRLTTDRDWRKTVGAALDSRNQLEEAAKAEQSETGEYIRPIVLFQAQSKSKNDPHRITVEALEKYLLEDKRLPEDQVAVVTGNKTEIDGVDLKDPDCSIRYIITVAKLKEGWDCPFAYVLCSVAEQTSKTAIEQILGRILRMPQARLKRRDALNRAYAYVASQSFDDAAQRLRDGLIEGAGFSAKEAEELISKQASLPYDKVADETDHESDAIEDEAVTAESIEEIFDKLPSSVKARVSFNPETKTVAYKGQMTREGRNLLQLATAKIPQFEKVIDRLYAKSNNFQTSAAADETKPPFIVPRLGFRKQGKLELFGKEHFLDLPWRLDECDPKAIVERFKVIDESQSGEIDVTDKGKVEIHFVRRLQGELGAVIQEPEWTMPRLANWLDMGIQHPDVTKPAAILFITGTIDALIASGIELDVLARNKYDLRKVLAGLINDLRKERENGNYQALFSSDAESFSTSSDMAMIFDEEAVPHKPYVGTTKFNKHYTNLIGDMKAEGEEFECAVHLDRHEKVQYWIRNVDRQKNSFWLQLPDKKFYPDFVVMLKDGRILIVEYKGEVYKTNDDSKIKMQIGDVWAEASDGMCLFCMPTARDFSIIDRIIS
ncbi:DEAD/DEAH box helicase [Planktotalea sp.]|uniref:DEAD/DEAH box helicase n=1 Tax=Planktotalea sp. TaxID=2029877 RepID=UPI003D6C6905